MLSYVNVNYHAVLSLSFNFPLSDEGYPISKSNCLPWADNFFFFLIQAEPYIGITPGCAASDLV